MKREWINTKDALQITKSYPKGPKSRAGLIDAGKFGKFIKKSSDGHHWLYEKESLYRYIFISNKPTLLSIAQQLKSSVGVIKYVALKNNIPFRKKMNRKYLEQTDVNRIIKAYKDNNHGKKRN